LARSGGGQGFKIRGPIFPGYVLEERSRLIKGYRANDNHGVLKDPSKRFEDKLTPKNELEKLERKALAKRMGESAYRLVLKRSSFFFAISPKKMS